MATEEDQKRTDWETWKSRKIWTKLVPSALPTEMARTVADWIAWLTRPVV
jgi:hypothetical protein